MATYPQDIVSAPSPNSGLLANAMSSTQQVTAPTTANAIQSAGAATSNSTLGKANAFAYDPSKATASTYNAAQATGTNLNVDNKSTVQGQLGDILSKSNPLMKSAEAKANQQMNQRGLLNSSMAVKAAQGAVMDYALPIANADAATNAAAAKYNADVANTTSQFNTTAKNQQQQFNAQNTTQVDLANQSAVNQAGATNAAANQQASQFNAQASNALQSQSLQNQQQTNLANQTAYNTAIQNDAQARQQANLANQQETSKLVMQNLDSVFKAELANADNQTKLQLQDMQTQTQKDLANIEAQYKKIMQANDSAGGLYQQVVKNITDITANKDLDAGAKNAAIGQQTNMLRDGLEMFGQMNALGINALVTF